MYWKRKPRFALLIALSNIFHFSNQAAAVTPANSDETNLETLRLVQVIFRHGDRTPIVQYPKDPLGNESLWPEGVGALTKKGKQMQYELGQYLRRRYDGFLSKMYLPSEVFVLSPDMDRSIMSALCSLAGLFPPSEEVPKSLWNEDIKWQPIPVRTLPDYEDNFVTFTANCPRFKELEKEHFRLTDIAREINENPENKKLFSFMSEHTACNISTLQDVARIHDTLKIQKLYRLPLPKWTQPVFPEETEPLYNMIFDARFQVPTREAMKVKCGPLLAHLLRNMEAMKTQEDTIAHEMIGGMYKFPRAKMYMYSGRDTIVSFILGTISEFTNQFPPYSSTVLLELHEMNSKENDDKENFFVKLFYRNSTEVPPYELEISGCGYPCGLRKLRDLYADVIVERDAWREACQPHLT